MRVTTTLDLGARTLASSTHSKGRMCANIPRAWAGNGTVHFNGSKRGRGRARLSLTNLEHCYAHPRARHTFERCRVWHPHTFGTILHRLCRHPSASHPLLLDTSRPLSKSLHEFSLASYPLHLAFSADTSNTTCYVTLRMSVGRPAPPRGGGGRSSLRC